MGYVSEGNVSFSNCIGIMRAVRSRAAFHRERLSTTVGIFVSDRMNEARQRSCIMMHRFADYATSNVGNREILMLGERERERERSGKRHCDLDTGTRYQPVF